MKGTYRSPLSFGLLPQPKKQKDLFIPDLPCCRPQFLAQASRCFRSPPQTRMRCTQRTRTRHVTAQVKAELGTGPYNTPVYTKAHQAIKPSNGVLFQAITGHTSWMGNLQWIKWIPVAISSASCLTQRGHPPFQTSTCALSSQQVVVSMAWKPSPAANTVKVCQGNMSNSCWRVPVCKHCERLGLKKGKPCPNAGKGLLLYPLGEQERIRAPHIAVRWCRRATPIKPVWWLGMVIVPVMC